MGAPAETCRQVRRGPPPAMEMPGVAAACKSRLPGASGLQMGIMDKGPLIAV